MLRPHLDSGVYLSRRPRARARQQRRTLPDWVWGIGIGVIVLGFVGAYFLITSGGGGGSTCDNALPPLGRSDVNAAAFQQEETDLGQLIDLVQAGDLNGANAAFFGKPVHSFSHNVDPAIREKDAGLAKDLCKSVLAFEDSLAFKQPAAQLVLKLEHLRDVMRNVAQVLGYPRPG